MCVCVRSERTTAAGSPCNLPLIPANEGNGLQTAGEPAGPTAARSSHVSAAGANQPLRSPVGKHFKYEKLLFCLHIFTREIHNATKKTATIPK